MRLQGGLVTLGMEEGTLDTPHTFEDPISWPRGSFQQQFRCEMDVLRSPT